MGSKLSGSAQEALEALKEAKRKWSRVHSLVERAAGARSGLDVLLMQMRRAAAEVQRALMNARKGPLADQANQFVMLVRRGGQLQSKIGAMRETVVAVDTGIDKAMRAVLKEGAAHDDEKE